LTGGSLPVVARRIVSFREQPKDRKQKDIANEILTCIKTSSGGEANISVDCPKGPVEQKAALNRPVYAACLPGRFYPVITVSYLDYGVLLGQLGLVDRALADHRSLPLPMLSD
jgi:hypothetical protein